MNWQALAEDAAGTVSRNDKNAAGNYVVQVRLPVAGRVGDQIFLDGPGSPPGEIIGSFRGFVLAQFDAVDVLVYCQMRGAVTPTAFIVNRGTP